ncbi:MAG: NAD(P)H-binding protein [Halioglobus sp.]
MKGKTVLFVGCGDLGMRAGQQLLEQNATVAAVRRNPGELPKGFQAYAGDYTRPGDLDFITELNPDYVVTSFTPAQRDTLGYEQGFIKSTQLLLRALQGSSVRQLVFVSSTRVYAEREGGWVDENSPLTQNDPGGEAIVRAESLLDAASFPSVRLRFGGIYGNPCGRLLQRVSSGELCADTPVSYSNRIHRMDAARVIVHCLHQAQAGVELARCYNGVDSLPAPQHEVEHWLAMQMGLAEESLRFTAKRMSVGHKRCRNASLLSTGFEFEFADYRAGYAQVLAERQA